MAQQPTAMERFIQGILPENPVFRQLLGMCPTLAVTGDVQSGLTMTGAVLFVLVCANIVISALRNLLQPHLRIVVFTITIATFVTIVDKLLAAYMYPMSKALGPYIALIIVNCIIICRCEVCAARQNVPIAIADAVGQSIGFGIALTILASIREILGAGTWLGLQVLPPSMPTLGIMGLPPGAFLTFGIVLAVIAAAIQWRKNAKGAKA